jgi:hypothetical protein
LDEWTQRLDKPTVTFIWRSDRAWRTFCSPFLPLRLVLNYRRKAARSRALTAGRDGRGEDILLAAPRPKGRLKQWLFSLERQTLQRNQTRWIVRLAERLRVCLPDLDFGVGGLMQDAAPFPEWIEDLRQTRHTDETARRMCQRYARSHLVLGCNGSSLLVPGMHAGAVIDLVPPTWWAVSAGSFPFRITHVADVSYRYALVPGEVSLKTLADIIVSIVRDRDIIALHTAKEWRDQDSRRDPADWAAMARRTNELRQRFPDPPSLFSPGA